MKPSDICRGSRNSVSIAPFIGTTRFPWIETDKNREWSQQRQALPVISTASWLQRPIRRRLIENRKITSRKTKIVSFVSRDVIFQRPINFLLKVTSNLRAYVSNFTRSAPDMINKVVWGKRLLSRFGAEYKNFYLITKKLSELKARFWRN